MSNTIYDLDTILNLQYWENLQDQLSNVTKMSIVTINYKGTPITQHSNCCPFCESVRKNPSLAKYCQICDSRGALEAVRSQKPYIYLCHFNIIDIAIPISVDDKYLGAIMAGQIKLSSDSNKTFEQMLHFSHNSILRDQITQRAQLYDDIPTLSYSEIVQSADLLFSLMQYIINSTLSKNKLINSYENLYSSVKELMNQSSSVPSSYNELNVKNYLPIRSSKKATPKSSILKPVLQYIDNNKDIFVTQIQMAELVHLSPSYFSRLFVQETGQTFTQYITFKKIEWARKLLEQSDKSIEEISNELGFSTAGYFIKVFKKAEGITPLLYRKYYENSYRDSPSYLSPTENET